MKKSIVFFTLFFIQIIFSQDSQKVVNDTIYLASMVDKQPEFIGGNEEFIKCISANIELPRTTEFKGGKIMSNFVVNTDGTLQDIKILKHAGFDTANEVIRLLSICNQWNAAEKKGQKVRCSYTLPIVFPAFESEVETNVNDSIPVFDGKSVHIQPEFPGGIDQFRRFISSNFRQPYSEKFDGGKLIIAFTIDTDGFLTNIKLTKDLGFGTFEEAVRVMMKSPRWIPAKIDGKNVRCSYSLPIVLPSNK